MKEDILQILLQTMISILISALISKKIIRKQQKKAIKKLRIGWSVFLRFLNSEDFIAFSFYTMLSVFVILCSCGTILFLLSAHYSLPIYGLIMLMGCVLSGLLPLRLTFRDYIKTLR